MLNRLKTYGNGRAVRHQGVHIGHAGCRQAFVVVKSPSQQRTTGVGQCPEMRSAYGVCMKNMPMTATGRARMIAQTVRCRKRSVLLVVRPIPPGVFQLFAVIAHQQIVTRSLQSRFQLFGAALCRVVFHGSRGRRVVDGGRAHPQLSVEVLSTVRRRRRNSSNTGNVLFLCVLGSSCLSFSAKIMQISIGRGYLSYLCATKT